MNEDPGVVASFLDEADERLEGVNRLLLEAEASRALDRDHAVALQRTLHNLKGAARMVGLGRFERLVHILEDLVKIVAGGGMELSVMIQLLLEGVDDLGAACRRMREKNRLFDSEDLDVTITKLELFLPDDENMNGPAPGPAPTGVIGTGASRQDAGAAPRDRPQGSVARVCRFDPDAADGMLDDFIAEAIEMFEQMQIACVSLEKRPTPEAVDSLFRVAHTIKGSSSAIGLEAMKVVMHRLEEQLDDVRRGAAVVTPRMIDLLLMCLDECTVIMEKVGTRRPFEHDIAPVMARLEAEEDPSAPQGQDPERQARGPAPADSSVAEQDVGAAPRGRPQGETGGGEVARSIRVDIAKLDTVINLVGELAIAKIRFDQRINELQNIREDLADRIRALPRFESDRPPIVNLEILDAALLEHIDDQRRSCDELQRISGDLQKAVMRTRMIPVGQVLTRFQRLVRDFSKAVGKPLKLEIHGEETEIDKTVAECISDPLMHIIRNAADHGIEPAEERKKAGKPESGTIRIEAMYQGDLVVIEIADDGGGISRRKVIDTALAKGLITPEESASMDKAAVHELLFRPGFSTATNVTDISGRGVGLDVVRDNITKLKGTVMLESEEGTGTRFTIKLPLTLAIIQALIVKVGHQRFALPLSAVQETLLAHGDEIHAIGTKESFNLRGEAVSLVRLGHILGFQETDWGTSAYRHIVVSAAGIHKVGLEVDAFEGKQEVVIKTLGTVLNHVRFTSGTTIMGDGSLVLIIDLAEVVRAAREWEETAVFRPAPPQPSSEPKPSAHSAGPVGGGVTFLLVDDSPTVLSVISADIEKLGVRVLTADDGEKALKILAKEKIDAVVTDVFMPRLDGYELCRRIRATPALEHMPVVMISSKGEKLDKKRGFDAGADDYLTKPFDPAVLAAKLAGFMKL